MLKVCKNLDIKPKEKFLFFKIGEYKMKVVFKAKMLDIKNKDKKCFYTIWNYFEINVSKYGKYYESIVTNPLGEMLVGASYTTMREAVQDSFNNIELDINEKGNMLTERNQLLQDGEMTEDDLSEIEYWYGDVVKKYY